MQVTFLGTRGNLRVRTRRHWRHTATKITGGRVSLMIDCGADWMPVVQKWLAPRRATTTRRKVPPRPSAILLTHAHPDHAAGLAGGAPCPVYATAETWANLGSGVPADLRRVVRPGVVYRLGGLTFEVAPVVHSVRFPTVAARVTGPGGRRRPRPRRAVFIAHDVAALTPAATRLLQGAEAYIGDGASYNRAVRPRGAPRGRAAGHASIREQLRWCVAAGVGRAWFTHCGTQILKGRAPGERRWTALLRAETGVNAAIVADGATVRP